MKRNLLAVFLLVVIVPSVPAPLLAGTISLPNVKGPIPETETSHPLVGARWEIVPEDLPKVGYVEEEYFVSGKADVYDDDNGSITVKASGGSYTTRILVRRPKDPNVFSGSIILSPMNPSTNVDLVDAWTRGRRYITGHHDVFVGVTIKPIAIMSLKKFDPERYAPLTMSAPPGDACTSPPAGGYAQPIPGMENGLLWDMLTQIGALLRSDSTPLKGFKAQYLYMSGGSQTGAVTIRYINSIHPTAELDNGKPIYDGYMPYIAAAMYPLNQCSKPLLSNDKRHITRNAGVPVIRIMSQSDFGGAPVSLGNGALSLRREDSDDPKDPYRLYEIPGSAHSTMYAVTASARADDYVKSGNVPWRYNCAEPEPYEGLEFTYIFDGALANLDRWVRKGNPPPRAERISTQGNSTTQTAVYDEFGNMKGGVRMAQLEVPIAAYVANSTPKAPSAAGGGCLAIGHLIPFSAQQLIKLYPTHSDYVNRVNAFADRLVSEGWLLKSDGNQLKADAAKATGPSSSSSSCQGN